jgi:TonB family protein
MSDFEQAAIHRVAPEYPPEAKSKRISGKVQLKLLVDQSGQVRAACPVFPENEPKPDSSLIDASRRAALQWKFPRNFGLRGKLRLTFDLVEIPVSFKFASDAPAKN